MIPGPNLGHLSRFFFCTENNSVNYLLDWNHAVEHGVVAQRMLQVPTLWLPGFIPRDVTSSVWDSLFSSVKPHMDIVKIKQNNVRHAARAWPAANSQQLSTSPMLSHNLPLFFINGNMDLLSYWCQRYSSLLLTNSEPSLYKQIVIYFLVSLIEA